MASRPQASIAAHPGVSDTELAKHVSKWLYFMLKPLVVNFYSHKPKEAALPTLMTALETT